MIKTYIDDILKKKIYAFKLVILRDFNIYNKKIKRESARVRRLQNFSML